MSDTAGESTLEFKKCRACGALWPTRAGFLGDPKIEVVGYQAFLPDPRLGMFLFNHLGCGTTLAINAEDFTDLYQGPTYSQRLTDTEACLQYCSNPDELRPCPNECECSYVREVLQVVRNWPKC